jgi:hypothetical protein
MYINSTFQEGSLLLSKMAMFTSEITKVLERNPTTAPLFIGCFAADRIPEAIGRYPHCMVVNLDRAANRGSHWIAIFRPNATRVEYYDSLGVWPPPSEPIRLYLSRAAERIAYNPIALQAWNAQSCGKHVIFFLHHRCSGVGMDAIIARLAVAKSPDRVVSDFIRDKIFEEYK